MRKLSKILLSIFAVVGISSAYAANDNSEISTSISIVSSCKFTSGLFTGDFGTMDAGSVATTAVQIAWWCAPDATYTITPINATITKTNTNGSITEDLLLTAYTDNQFTSQFNSTTNTISGQGTGLVQNQNIYFKLTGKGPDLGNGKIIVEPVVFNMTNALQYPIHLAY